MFLVTLERLGLTGAKAQVSVGWKEIHDVVERSPYIVIQMRMPYIKKTRPGYQAGFLVFQYTPC